VGHHFGRPGNRFWKALFGAGFTPRLLSPYEDRALPSYGCGITNLVDRATTAADELSRTELAAGKARLILKVRRYRPKAVAVLGVDAFRKAFDRPRAKIGLQTETIGETLLWVLPNPSGLNANYQIADLIRLFKELHDAV
jgi:TDG/mug DNA glycosylase family protein